MTPDDDPLVRYVDSLFVREPPILVELRETLEEEGLPTIQVPARTGRVLELIAFLADARRILEIGTLGGYSALWLARGMADDGRIVTLEKDPERAELARSFIDRAGEAERIEVHVGDAREQVPQLGPDGGYDLVFIDADKESYTFYLDEARRLLRSRGVVLADNALWHGQVVEDEPDETTRGSRRSTAGSPGRRRSGPRSCRWATGWRSASGFRIYRAGAAAGAGPPRGTHHARPAGLPPPSNARRRARRVRST